MYPFGHLGSVPLTFLVVLPLTQTIVFLFNTGLDVTTVPVRTIVALVETGARVMVPLFIEPGDKIKVSTEDGSYLERVKE